MDPCDDSRLSALLRAPEDSAEYHVAAVHVEACARCRQRLTELAADDDAWEEARSQLRHLGQAPGEPVSLPTDSEARLHFLSAPSHPEMLGRLGRYEVERVIGSGGMGVVLKAYDSELHRPVAIKAMAPHLAHSGAARQRFAREARAAAAVVHEHVIAIHDVVADNETPYIVMQYVPGQSLQTRLDTCGRLSVMEILRIATQAALGLEAAHAQGLVHRDVKPANILLQDGVERITLTDFGLARTVDDATMTHSGIIAGTPQYMSPEQARGEPIDHRSDLFSLGSVMYAMCTGRAPFRAETTMGVLRRISDAEPHSIRDINPEVPVWLVAIVKKLLNKGPDDRFSSAAEVATLLESCLKHVQTPDSAPLPEKVRELIADSRRPSVENTISLAAAAILLVMVLVFAVLMKTENSAANSSDQARAAVEHSEGWDDGVATQIEALEERVNSITDSTEFWNP